MGNNQREMYKTGGGPARTLNLSSDEEVLLSLIGPSTFGLTDRGCGDKEFLSSSETSKETLIRSWKGEMDESIEFLDSDVEILFEENQNDDLKFCPSEAVNILKRPIQNVLATEKSQSDNKKVNINNSFPTLESYEKPKTRKRNDEKLDDLIEEYEDLKKERKLLLTEQMKYYIDKNQREKLLFDVEMDIKKMQKEEIELKLKVLKN